MFYNENKKRCIIKNEEVFNLNFHVSFNFPIFLISSQLSQKFSRFWDFGHFHVNMNGAPSSKFWKKSENIFFSLIFRSW